MRRAHDKDVLGLLAGVGAVLGGLVVLLGRVEGHLQRVSAAGRTGFAAVVLIGLVTGVAVSDRVLSRAAGSRMASRLSFAGLATAYAGLLTGVAAYLPAWSHPIVTFPAGLALGVAVVPGWRLLGDASGLSKIMRSVGAGALGVITVVYGPPFIGATSNYATTREWKVALPVGEATIRGACLATVLAGLITASRFFRAVQRLDTPTPSSPLAPTGSSPRPVGAEPLLEVDRINVSYGRVQVLFDLSFDVAEGEAVALLGTNGAGKSTLLRAAFGLVQPSSGSVRFGGLDVTREPAERRMRHGLVQVPGGRGVFPSMTVLENLQVAGYHVRSRTQVAEGIARTLASFPNLEARLTMPAGLLSGGEQQMLALGRAFIGRPRLLAIDELTLGLAPAVVDGLIEFVRELNRDGMAIVIVEQSAHVAFEIAHRAYFLERGQVRFSGATADLLQREDLLRSVFLSGVGAEG